MFFLVTGRILKRREFTRFPMPDVIINRLNVWGNKTKCDIYDNVIKFKDRSKNTYHWDYEDGLDGLLEQTKPHETDSIPAEFPGVKFDSDKADVTPTYQEVENDNTVDDGSSANSGIVHGNPNTDGMEGTALPLLADDNDDNITEVDMPENEPAKIIDFDAEDATDG